MIPSSSLFYLIGALAIGSISTIAAPSLGEANAAKLNSRQSVSAPLTGGNGPVPEDIIQGVWDSSWLHAPAAALSLKAPKILSEIWKDISQGVVAEYVPGQVSRAANFTLYNSQGIQESFGFNWMQLSLAKKADYNREIDTPNWWFPGIEYSALKLGGFLGLDHTEINKGNPQDAFYMLTGKKAEYFSGVNSNSRLWQFLEANKSTNTSIIFETKNQTSPSSSDSSSSTSSASSSAILASGLDAGKWYPFIGSSVDRLKMGQEPWKSGNVTCYDAKDGNRFEIEFEELVKDIQNVVYLPQELLASAQEDV